MLCQNCGTQLSEHDQFCPNCGTQVSSNTTEMIATPNATSGEVRLPEISMIAPNLVGNLDRDSLLNVFGDIRTITTFVDKIYSQTSLLMDEIEKEKKTAGEMQKKLSGWVLKGALAIAIFFAIVFLIELGGVGFILGLIMGFIAGFKFLEYLDKAKNSKKRQLEAEAYLAQKLPPLQNQIKANQGLIEDILTSPQAKWAEDIIGKDLFYTEAIDELISYVKSRRADTLKEALNKYDSTQHINRMEEMQRSIQNAAELTAEEAIKQTEYAEETSKHARRAATAAAITAYNTRQIDKNTRKFRK